MCRQASPLPGPIGASPQHFPNRRGGPGFHLNLRASDKGLAFIFSIEVGPLEKVTAHLHWPGGSSGVTLGPGYDMRDRQESQIEADLLRVGVDKKSAKRVSAAAGLKGSAAEDFADDNRDLVSLAKDEQIALLKLIVPGYERIVTKHVHVPLEQHEFDALVSFAYNPGGRFSPIAKAINSDHLQQAADIMKMRVLTGGKTSKGLVKRRQRETRLLLEGKY